MPRTPSKNDRKSEIERHYRDLGLVGIEEVEDAVAELLPDGLEVPGREMREGAGAEVRPAEARLQRVPAKMHFSEKLPLGFIRPTLAESGHFLRLVFFSLGQDRSESMTDTQSKRINLVAAD